MRAMAVLAVVAMTMHAAACRAQAATVEAVQFPAWLERGGRAVPLAPGMPVEAKDSLLTGANARVLLRLGEGSTVKIGENARFVVERVEDRGLFRAAFAVVAGAFRYTSTIARPRDISIRAKHVTAGIRGTDVWGKSEEASGLVCLLEGRVSVSSPGHPAVTLETPLDFYRKRADGAPEIARVDEKQLAEWARETEIGADGAAALRGGRWRVVAAVLPTRDAALRMNRAVRSAGYPSEIAAQEGYFSVQVAGFGSEAQARAAMGNLRAVPGVTLPKVVPMP